jgi:CRISPR-associated endonuclease/helicase Cas3
MPDVNFADRFQALTGNSPFPWQEALYRRLVAGEPPASCALPTGLGKTSVIPIWLLALAAAPDRVPRRLVYVVNRRTVVDQATREAERLRERLVGCREVERALRGLCAGPEGAPLAISTLRGQFADNAEWRADPARPAVAVGTVDMVGSRLLFSGYGCGFRSRPLHAGFLGQAGLPARRTDTRVFCLMVILVRLASRVRTIVVLEYQGKECPTRAEAQGRCRWTSSLLGEALVALGLVSTCGG